AARSVDRHHPPARPRDLGKILRREPRPASEVEQSLADGEAGAAPGVECTRTPHPVLQTEAHHLVVMSAEDVVAFCNGHAGVTRVPAVAFATRPKCGAADLGGAPLPAKHAAEVG